MKKNVKWSILLSSLLAGMVQAQVVKTSESTNLIPVVGAGNPYTTIANPNGASQTVISIGPRLAIQSPWWINNMANAITDKGNNKKETDKEKEVNIDKESEKVEKNIKKVELSDTGEAKPTKPIASVINESAEKKSTVVEERKTGQTTFKTVMIKTNDIAGSNNTSLEEMAKIGQIQTEKALRSNIR